MTRILVIDDDRASRQQSVGLLGRAGYDVIVARDGLAGLQRCLEDAPDLVLLQRELAGLGARDVRRRLAREPATRALPVLLMPPGVRAGDAAALCGLLGEIARRIPGPRRAIGSPAARVGSRSGFGPSDGRGPVVRLA